MAKIRRRKGLFAKKRTAKNGGARRRKAARPRTRRNPGGVVIGDSALELRYEGGQGKRSKKDMRGPWKHEFETDDVQVIGKSDGSVELRSKSGARLWDNFEV